MMRTAAAASEPHVHDVAMKLLARGNAVDAVVAGVFAAAALGRSVLLGPVQILVGGPGAGLRAVDGRGHQPGFGVPRPRGFVDGETIPDAARVAVPALPAALCSVLAACGTSSLAHVLAPAIDLSRAVPERARLLRRISERGPIALTEKIIATELVHAAGRVAGGLLTTKDLEDLRPALLPAASRVIGGARARTVPWGAAAVVDASVEPENAARVHVVAAGDAHGLLAIACYEIHEEGVEVPELGLVAPMMAAPVLRGQPRVRPGEARPCPAPIGLLEQDEAAQIAIGTWGAASSERELAKLFARLGEAMAIETAMAQGEGHSLGVVRTKMGARAVSRRAASDQPL